MPRFSPKRYEQILSAMLAKLVTRTYLSDVADTSIWKHVLAAAARQDDEQYYQMVLLLQLFSLDDATGEDLDARAKEIQPGILEREAAVKSSGNVVIYRTNAIGTIAIPENTEVLTTDGEAFVTTAAGSITPTSPEQIAGHGIGRDSGLIPAVAKVGGIAGNAEADTIIKFATKPVGVEGVTNPVRFAWGLDEESDDSFRNRIKSYVSNLARGTIYALESAVLGATDPDTGARILYAKAVEDYANRGYVTLYIDDGTGSALSSEVVPGENITEGLAGPPADSAVGGESYLFLDYKPVNPGAGYTISSSIRGALVNAVDYYINPASGQINFTPALVASEVITGTYTRYTGLIEEAQKIIDGDTNDRINYPGYRSGGILVSVLTPQILIQTLDLTVTVLEGYDPATVKTQVETALLSHVNTMGISGDLLLSDLIKVAKAVPGVYDVLISIPLANVILLDDQLARTTAANVAVN